MKQWLWGFLAIFLAAIVMESGWCFTTSAVCADPPVAKTVRIGVYDPRAVAIAYSHSRLFRQKLDAKQKEMAKAKAANDQDQIKALKTWGQDQQVRLHLQGFAGAPVDDILAEVKDQLPEIAETADVQTVGLRPNYSTPNVEIVDVTDDLVRIWSPDAATLKMISGLEKTAPYPIEQIAKMGPND